MGRRYGGERGTSVPFLTVTDFALVKPLQVSHFQVFCSDHDFDIRLKESCTSLYNSSYHFSANVLLNIPTVPLGITVISQLRNRAC